MAGPTAARSGSAGALQTDGLRVEALQTSQRVTAASRGNERRWLAFDGTGCSGFVARVERQARAKTMAAAASRLLGSSVAAPGQQRRGANGVRQEGGGSARSGDSGEVWPSGVVDD